MLALRSSQRLGLRSLLPAVYKNVGLTNSYSSSSQSKDDDGGYSSDDEKPKKKAPKKVEETAAQRLNRLLGSMQATDQMSAADFPRPGEANRRRKEALKQDAASKNVLTAAKNIASMLGTSESDKKQTESELLAKLLGHGAAAPPAASGEAQASDPASGGAAPEKELNLSELIVGMKIDRRQQPQQVEQTRGEYVRRTMASRSKHSDRYQQRPQRHTKREAESFTGSVNLFGGEPLGIFKEPLPISGDILSTWSQLSERELSLHAAHPPANYFEQMVLWTEQGKVWRFPIDNEQDWVDEVNVDFSEHIFLDQHLEDWCPSRGPIRHFMELVCVGLSKNPYVTAQEKKDHIMWFRDYFETKKDILKDLMENEPSVKVKSVSA
ncbi:28S ribosomal protein S31, mitochondrial [Drosophila guanche]|uniref:Small ribosomal subunit protein mS31 n=1 Tax=Drosophila guanche TaxID=7266 RepID=A0A3B0JSX2_DROGU|nr:28S ribosomal protein S31, mitochondrial [Drosophila guanche]SPP76799.1 blast:28S ribosomal protein S31%2C mitochondrial [Drosophila guanche]